MGIVVVVDVLVIEAKRNQIEGWMAHERRICEVIGDKIEIIEVIVQWKHRFHHNTQLMGPNSRQHNPVQQEQRLHLKVKHSLDGNH